MFKRFKLFAFFAATLTMAACSFGHMRPAMIRHTLTTISKINMLTPSGGIPIGSGSASAIGPNLLLTAAHVCQDREGTRYKLSLPNGTPLTVVAVNTIADLCLLRSDKPHKLNVLKISDTQPVKGDKVYVFGSPLGFPDIITEGYYGKWHNQHRAQLSVLGNPGNSGSPVLNTRGRIVGVLVQGVDAYPVLTFTPPLAAIKDIVERWKTSQD